MSLRQTKHTDKAIAVMVKKAGAKKTEFKNKPRKPKALKTTLNEKPENDK